LKKQISRKAGSLKEYVEQVSSIMWSCCWMDGILLTVPRT